MKRLVLLGAGASKEAGLPLAREMSYRFLEAFKARRDGHSEKVLLFVLGGLALKRGMHGQDVAQPANVEEVFSAIQMIAKRHQIEAAPFVSAWHPHIEDLEARIYRQDLAEILEKAVSHNWYNGGRRVDPEVSPRPPSRSDLEEYISGLTTTARRRSVFAQTNSAMLRLLRGMVTIKGADSSRVDYLRPLVRWSTESRTSIATLSYDNSIELAADSEGIAVSTCVEEWSDIYELSEPRRDSLELLKIHGSANWVTGHKNEIRIVDPVAFGRGGTADQEPVLVFGEGNKLRADGPFLDLFDRFRRRIAEAKVVGIVGYSFSDIHVNIQIERWHRRSSEHKLIILGGPGFNLELTSALRSWDKSRIEAMPIGAKEGMPAFIKALETGDSGSLSSSRKLNEENDA